MTWWEVGLIIGGTWFVAACMLGPMVGRLLKGRQPKSMPRRPVPGLPVDGPPLSPHENTRYWLTVAALRVGAEAEDPMEDRKP
jgi:hypothetical protein